MPDRPSKTAWEAENIVRLTIKINRNTDPQLFQLFSAITGSKSEIARDMLRSAVAITKKS